MINNEFRRRQIDRYKKYMEAAAKIGVQIPARYIKEPDAAVNWLSKEDQDKWEAVKREAQRIYPETFHF